MINILLVICIVLGVLGLVLYKLKFLSENSKKVYIFFLIGLIIVTHIISWIE